MGNVVLGVLQQLGTPSPVAVATSKRPRERSWEMK